MRKKKIRVKARFFLMLFLFVAFIGAIVYTYKVSEKQGTINIVEADLEQMLPDEKYLSIFSNKVYLVYGEKIAIECDVNINLKKNITIEKLIKQENYKEILNRLNGVMPEKLNKYVLAREIDSGALVIEMPYIETDAGRYISNVEVNNIFNDNYYKSVETKKNKIIVDMMNGTGDSNYALRTGKYLTKKYGYIINHTEYESKSQYSYIIANDIDEDEIRMLVRGLREKFIKIGKKASMNTMAKMVVILGDDKVKDFKVKIFSQNGANIHVSKLKARGYTGIEKVKIKKMPEEDKIVYNGEDYYTAVKISELLGITVFEQDDSKKNIIDVYITGGE